MSEKIILRYTLTMDDHIQAMRSIFLSAKPIRLLLYLCCPILLLMGIVILVFSNGVGPLTFLAIMCMVFAFYYVFYFLALLPFMSRRRVQKSEGFGREVVWEITDDRIVMKGKLAESSLDWAAFKEARETKTLYLLKTGSFAIIPKRAFESSDQESAFRSMVRSHITKVRFKLA